MSLPGTNCTCIRMSNRIETLNPFEGEVVDEADSATSVGMVAAFDDHVNGTQRTLILRICNDFYP